MRVIRLQVFFNPDGKHSRPAKPLQESSRLNFHNLIQTDFFTMKSIFLIPVFFFTLVSLTATTTNNVNNNDNGSEPTFQDFLAQFPKAGLPYAFRAEDLQAQMEKRTTAPVGQRLTWEYYHFLPMLEESARHNRMPVYPEAVAAFETKEY